MDPVVGETNAATVELVAAGACAFGSIPTQVLVLAALGVKASFGGMVTVVLVPIADLAEGLAGAK